MPGKRKGKEGKEENGRIAVQQDSKGWTQAWRSHLLMETWLSLLSSRFFFTSPSLLNWDLFFLFFFFFFFFTEIFESGCCNVVWIIDNWYSSFVCSLEFLFIGYLWTFDVEMGLFWNLKLGNCRCIIPFFPLKRFWRLGWNREKYSAKIELRVLAFVHWCSANNLDFFR